VTEFWTLLESAVDVDGPQVREVWGMLSKVGHVLNIPAATDVGSRGIRARDRTGVVMKAMLGTTVLAEAAEDELIQIEGNWYFPPASVVEGVLSPSPTPYTCPWKGECQYFNVVDGDSHLSDRAWSYPTPKPTAIEQVGKDFSGYVAFWKEVSVTE
jgi:uncharacterized protein (DUF427 family)